MTAETYMEPIPDGWNHDACHLWASGQQVAAVQKTLDSLSGTTPGAPRLALQAAYYLYLIGDHAAGAAILEQQLKITPEHTDVLLNLAVFYSRMGRSANAVEMSRRVLAKNPDEFTALDVLAKSLHRLKNYPEAAKAGSQALALKDRLSSVAVARDWAVPQLPAAEFAQQANKSRVIAYSLWGGQPNYLRGALRNLLLATDLYPGWTLRFYLDASVPKEFVGLIRQLGGEVLMQPENQSTRQKLCWRFSVANDPNVGYFQVRDVDSVMNLREVLAVDAWLASGKWFHIMRDWWTHTDLVLAGMWGGVAGVLPQLEPLLMAYQSGQAETPNVDQWFLRDQVWPYLKTSCLVHDRCFRPAGAMPFPTRLLEDHLHVGLDEYAAHRAQQERILAPWIRAYGCLGPLQSP